MILKGILKGSSSSMQFSLHSIILSSSPTFYMVSEQTESNVIHIPEEKEVLTMELDGSVSSLQDGPTPQWGRGTSPDQHYGSFANSLASLTSRAAERPPSSPKRAYLAVAVLCYINLLNYTERYTIAGSMISCARQRCPPHDSICCMPLVN